MAPQDPATLIDGYLEGVASCELIGPEEQTRLLAKARSGDRPARKRLIESYLAATAWLALEACSSPRHEIDALQDANAALVALIVAGEADDIPMALPGAVATAVRKVIDPPFSSG